MSSIMEHLRAQSSPVDSDLLTVKEVGRRLRLKRMAIARLIKAQAFPNATKPGKAWRIPKADVDAYLRERSVSGGAE